MYLKIKAWIVKFLIRLRRRKEERLIYDILTFPACFDLGLYGILHIRSTDQGIWEVQLEEDLQVPVPDCLDYHYKENGYQYFVWSFKDPVKAVKKFEELRHESEMGEDYSTIHYLKSK